MAGGYTASSQDRAKKGERRETAETASRADAAHPSGRDWEGAAAEASDVHDVIWLARNLLPGDGSPPTLARPPPWSPSCACPSPSSPTAHPR